VPDAISHRDLETALEIAEQLADITDRADLRERTVAVLGTVVPASYVTWNDVDQTNDKMDVTTPIQVSNAERQDFDATFLAHIQDHPVITNYARTGDGRPYAISDFLSVEDFHATNLYQKIYRRLSVEDQLSFVLPDPQLLVGVAVNRAERGFSARDRVVCNLIRPHLMQAYRNASANELVQRTLSAAEALAAHGNSIVVLNARGRVELLSDSARLLLQSFYGWTSAAADLPTEIQDWMLAISKSRVPQQPLVRQQDRQTLVVRRVGTDDGAVLVLSDHFHGDIRPQWHQLGLTARESEVLGLVANGLSTKQIATQLQISPRTVDKHVANGLNKIGARTRLEAVALLSETTLVRLQAVV
jgi:DNA-binding CsgD family transcriptional regulator